ncbi:MULTISPECIES: tyrosine--tRNA ligase [unclassified Gordonia (in: high G+C Gram-positive bacteria)]|uniref:tyrosine--tRNA ligase n=1 Tax=unclassified Gordonia (in: high G+C Gram-positive bacteria) TaxID=2657482 RepID=UPI0009913454|nr:MULTISPECIES: tyrosine--tRNA ligase [unclassified Gordonia (in: high G+C Gram-positive bacteria)]MBN0974743.1 tyrosine--tRNA ligase [Gordonia sp. BP-119]MBN0984779.1 tyrosine--tRNA ligase [Gordonia sp. BP-94]
MSADNVEPPRPAESFRPTAVPATVDILDELQWRGLIAQSTDLGALGEALANGPVTLYAGFDPTAASLHAGHLVPLLTLKRFQLAGHRPIVLAGGATGLIGDPRDVGERTMNSADTVAEWAARIDAQLRRFVDIDDTPTGAVVVNNLDWTGKLSAIEFLRDLGKHFSVNVMLARDTVKRRLEADGMSYAEFSYLLLQSNDFVELNRRYGCVLQIGGSDQWGNIVGGVDLARRLDGSALHGMTVPLVTSSDGKKFGKSTGGGSLWLDPELTSPYSWYQYFVNTADADVIRYLRWFTFLGREEIDELERATAETPHLRRAQRTLAAEMTTLIHGQANTDAVQLASQALFGRAELDELDEATLAAAVGETSIAEYSETRPTIIELLVDTKLSESNKAARRAVSEGGAYVNNTKITDPEWQPADADLLHGRWLVVRRGKKSFAGAKLGL